LNLAPAQRLLALFKASKALAFIRGRSYVIPDDVKYLAPYILPHRLLLHREERYRGTRVEPLWPGSSPGYPSRSKMTGSSPWKSSSGSLPFIPPLSSGLCRGRRYTASGQGAVPSGLLPDSHSSDPGQLQALGRLRPEKACHKPRSAPGKAFPW
jgi:hypothetical protein